MLFTKTYSSQCISMNKGVPSSNNRSFFTSLPFHIVALLHGTLSPCGVVPLTSLAQITLTKAQFLPYHAEGLFPVE
jgi:hypothetical protein